MTYGPRCRSHAHICMFQSYHHMPGDKINLAVYQSVYQSVYLSCFIFGTSFVALRCTFSRRSRSCFSIGGQATLAYSSICLIRLVNNFTRVLPSMYACACLISSSSLFALISASSTCLLKIRPGSTWTPRSCSLIVPSGGMSVPFFFSE